MGLRGPAPQPTKLKMIRGNPGRRPLNDQEPQPDPTPPTCPNWIDDIAKAKWAELSPELTRLGLLTSIDGDALAAYCQAFAEFQLATETLQTESRFFSTDKGYLAPHPAVSQQRSAWETMKSFAAMFGLNPSSRSRLKVMPRKNDKDPFDGFLDGDR